jgi:putative membrane protein
MFTTSTMRIRAKFSENKYLRTFFSVYVIFWGIMAISPSYRMDWFLENILVFLFVPTLTFTYKRFPLSDFSYLLITAFMILHTIGAHYTYAGVPFGYWIRDALGLQRNAFDRLVHFSFGLLMAYPVREVFLRVAHTKGFWTYYLPLDVTLAFSALFEIIEMLVAVIVSPEAGDAYLGTQGDIWDAQKDMAFAFSGAVICMVTTAILRAVRARWRSQRVAEQPAT